MSDVFISYSREDKEFVSQLAPKLRSQGLSVFWDKHIEVGKSWRKVLREELESAQCIVVVWSNNSIKSNWVLEEAQIGLDRQILIPLSIQSINPPLGFRGVQTAVLSRWDGELLSTEFNTLVAGIQSTLDQTKPKQKTVISSTVNDIKLSAKHSGNFKKPVILIGAIIFVLAMVLSIFYWPEKTAEPNEYADSKESKENRVQTSKALEKVLEDEIAKIQLIKVVDTVNNNKAEQYANNLTVSKEEAKNILLSVEVLEKSGDYEAAWRTLSDKKPVSDEAKIIIGQKLENLAMKWLRNIVVREGGITFSEIIGRVQPVILNGLSTTNKTRKADLLAHIGWAQFLKGRDGNPSDPEVLYKEALQLDPNNPYANAFYGHWTLWRQGSFSIAEQYFEAAIASDRVLNFVLDLQLSALSNARSKQQSEAMMVKVVSQMIQNGIAINERKQSKIGSIYYFAGRTDTGLANFTSIVPAETQLSVIRTLFFDQHYPTGKRRSYAPSIAMLLKQAGKPRPAKRIWQALRAIHQAHGTTYKVERADRHITLLNQ